jgi:hypothetical protein
LRIALTLAAIALVTLGAACGTGRPLALDPTPQSTAAIEVAVTLATTAEPTPSPANEAPTSTPTAVPTATPDIADEDAQQQMVVEGTVAPTPEPTAQPIEESTPVATAEPAEAPSTTVPVDEATPAAVELAAAPYTSPAAALPGVAPRLETLAVPTGSYLDDATVVSLYGFPGICAMGELGCHSIDRTIGAVQQLTDRYDALNGDRGAIAALHLIVDVAQPTPRSDGSYLGRMSLERIGGYVELARRHGLLLFLDLQIGWEEPVDGVRRLAPFLDEPFVHIAIDPEFATRGKGAAPGEVVGQVNASQVNAVQHYLAGFVRQHSLPPKIFVIHQFRTSMLIEPERFADVPEVDLSIDMDGVGANRIKLDGYWRYALADYSERPTFKLFLQRDTPQVLTPEEVLALDTPPDYIIYQ